MDSTYLRSHIMNPQQRYVVVRSYRAFWRATRRTRNYRYDFYSSSYNTQGASTWCVDTVLRRATEIR